MISSSSLSREVLSRLENIVIFDYAFLDAIFSTRRITLEGIDRSMNVWRAIFFFVVRLRNMYPNCRLSSGQR